MIGISKMGGKNRKKKVDKKRRGQKRTFYIFIHIIKHCFFLSSVSYGGVRLFVSAVTISFFFYCFFLFFKCFVLAFNWVFFPHFFFLWVISFHCNRYFFFNTSWHGKESHQRFFFSKSFFSLA